jgi:hypothetical protein
MIPPVLRVKVRIELNRTGDWKINGKKDVNWEAASSWSVTPDIRGQDER